MNYKSYLQIIVCALLGFFARHTYATNYYYLRDIHVVGNQNVSSETVITLFGIKTGATIAPSSPEIATGIKKITTNQFIKSVEVYFTDTNREKFQTSITIHIKEYPRLGHFSISGISKKDINACLEEIKFPDYIALSDFYLKSQAKHIEDFFKKKGFKNAKVSMELSKDISENVKNSANLKIHVNKGEKYMVKKVIFHGNDHISDQWLLYAMQTLHGPSRLTLFSDIFKQIITLRPIRKGGILLGLPKTRHDIFYYLYNHVAFRSSIFTEADFNKACVNMVSFYQSKGFRDVEITKRKVIYPQGNYADLHFTIKEGQKYFIGKIKWSGNHIYTTEALSKMLDVKEGEVYNLMGLKERLYVLKRKMYLDHGYLRSDIELVETGIYGNRIDLEIKILEHVQMTINQVGIEGNKYTRDAILFRELKTLPGDKVSVDNIEQSVSALNRLAFVTLTGEPKIMPNTTSDSVDIIYPIKESFNLPLQLKMEGLFQNFTLELGCTNFSLRNLLRGKIPLGGAQQLAIKGKIARPRRKKYSDRWSYGNDLYHKMTEITFSFKEPSFSAWNIPFILSLDCSYSNQWIQHDSPSVADRLIDSIMFPHAKLGHEFGIISSIDTSIGIGKRFFSHSMLGVKFNYNNSNYKSVYIFKDYKKRCHQHHAMDLEVIYKYNSENHCFFPTKGCSISNSLTIPVPHKALSNDLFNAQRPYKLTSDASLSFSIINKKLISYTRNQIGSLFNLSNSPIDLYKRFHLGNLSGGILMPFNHEDVYLCGYPNYDVTPINEKNKLQGGVLYHRFISALRYPLTMKMPMIYMSTFFEMGGCWRKHQCFDIQSYKKSVGCGLSILTPPMVILPSFPINFGIVYQLDESRDLDNSGRLQTYFRLGEI